MKANIIDNKVFCPICKLPINRVCDSKQTQYGTQMICKCNKCNEEFTYYVKCLLEGQIRFNMESEED